ncbi:MAG TPA: T9SS type A sorting domain-containing protein [bacterium]|nr:T9SS type A sorting domain-containing protein [bacterium]HPN46177.1 T9SS type A sorting domain-containing protein [bacterium]
MKLIRNSLAVLMFFLLSEVFAALSTGQGYYRWRNDDGSETTATWMAEEHSETTAGPGYNFRLRLEIFSGFAPYEPEIKLTYSDDIEGPWIDITTDGSVNAFKISPSSYFADGEVTTDQLSNYKGGTPNGGQMVETATPFSISVGAGESQEFEWCIQATNNADHGTTYYFRVMESDNLPLQGYVYTPSLTFDQALPVELAAFTAQQQGKNVLLNWTTASETDNLGFILERRVNGAQWQTIASYQTDATLKGKGNATTNTLYSFTDTQAPVNTSCEYRLADVDIYGAVSQIGTTQINLAAIPTAFVLEPAYPNPFNPATNICFHLAQDGLVKLTVLDMLGRAVKTIDNTWLPAGSYTRVWSAVNDNNLPVPSGVYFFRLETANTNLVQKAVLIR